MPARSNEIIVRIVGEFLGVTRITAALMRDGVVVDANFKRLIGLTKEQLIERAKERGWSLVWPRKDVSERKT